MNLRQIQELKERNVPDYRKDFIRLVARQDAELDVLLDDLVDETHYIIEDKSRNNKIQDKDSIALVIPVLFSVFARDWLGLMQDKNQDAAEIQVDYQNELVRKAYVGVPGFSDTFSRYMEAGNKYVANTPTELVRRGFPGSDYVVGERIKSIEKESVKVVQTILEVGIRNGKSARDIANDIEMYLKPLPEGKWISPFDWIRDYLGRYSVSRIEKGIVPRGSVSSNAFGIARTEINNTFRHATVDLNKNMPWLKGYIWRLSASHPKTDICDDWAKGSPYKANEIPEGHPHCMCYVIMEILTARELSFL